MEGIVYKSTGSHYLTKSVEGQYYICKLRGKLKIDQQITSSNPIAVGDIVEFEIENKEENLGIIQNIKPRKNYIVRVSPQNRKHHQHIIASNLDQAIIVATLVQPQTSLGFIDRFLVTAEAYHVPAIIVFNKSDLHIGAIEELYTFTKNIYTQIGYQVIEVSTITELGLEQLKSILKDKTTLLSGHSGVGKSSIINMLDSERSLKVQEISDWSGKGRHTTTFAEMIDLNIGGKLIDTPGVKEFGLVNMEKEELSHYFPEMRALLENCKFNNCMHLNEPQCAIKEAVIEGTISEDRYESYQNLLSTLEYDPFQ